MFMSGADQSHAELRLASIKGALRFWWRALAWGRLNGDLVEIRQQENELFGSTDTGQAAVLMKLHPYQSRVHGLQDNKQDRVLYDGNNVIGDGARYLGYGVIHTFESKDRKTRAIKNYAGELIRPCLLAPFTFQVSMTCKPSVKSKQVKQLKEAIKLFGFIGGIGSKARKGYGSVILTRLEHNSEVWQPPETLDEMKGIIESVTTIGKHTANQPSYTALSANSRFLLIEGNNNESALSLLNRIGREQVCYRSWGNKNKHTGQHEVLNKTRAEQNFQDDHDLMQAVAMARPIQASSIEHPERVAFGLPHNYFFSSTQSKADVKAVDYKSRQHLVVIDRRASPLFIHLHQLETKPVALLAFLPSQFLPNTAKIRLEGNLQKDAAIQSDESLWIPLQNFLIG